MTTRGDVTTRIDAQELIDVSRQWTGLTDFGELDPLKPLRILVQSLNDEACLTASGAAGKRASLIRVLCNRLLLHDAFLRLPQIAEQHIVSPLVIVGLPRSGTTKLHRMIAADPRMQKLPLWKLMYPVRALPPEAGAAADDSDCGGVAPRIALTQAFVDALRTSNRGLFAAHPMLTLEPDEEYFAMEISFQAQLNTSSFHTPSYQRWLDAQPFDNWYIWLRKFLQYQQFVDQSAGQPWVLKAPHHLAYLPLLFQYFPDATVIHCHREPIGAIASYCGLIQAARRGTSYRDAPAEIGRYSLDTSVQRLYAYLQDRPRSEPEHRFVDLAYADIVADAPAAIQTCYEVAGLPLPAASLAAMRAWESANAQHKHGQHRYDLQGFDLTEAEVVAAFRPYSGRFACFLHN